MFDPAHLPSALRAVADPADARYEDAGLNASQPPEQVLYDGWLVRFAPGRAKRARSINAIVAGRLPLQEKINACRALFTRSQLPLLFRITPFTQPATLDAELARAGLRAVDESRVMAAPLDAVQRADNAPGCASELTLREPDIVEFAGVVGHLRASPTVQIDGHRRRLQASPLAATRLLVERDGAPVAAGQIVYDANGLAGVYDVVTAESQRGQGIGGWLTRALLSRAAERSVRIAYLQVDVGNEAARRIYQQLGFVDRYAYWYRVAPDGSQ
jgi:ribosomal protein S18 acetylase RimI-like enzyme